MFFKRKQNPVFPPSKQGESFGNPENNVQLQASLMHVLSLEKLMTIEEVVAAFPCKRWTEIFEAVAQLHRQDRVSCRVSDRELELTAINRKSESMKLPRGEM